MKQKRDGKRTVFYVVAAVVLLVAVGGAYWWWNAVHLKPKAAESPTQAVASISAKANNAAYGTNGSGQSGVDVYTQAIKQTSDSAQQVVLYEQQSALARNNGLYDQAITAALKAISIGDQTNPDQPYFFAATAYEAKGDYANAATYYQQALDAYKKKAGTSNSATAQFYQSKIDAMKAKG